MYMPQSLYNQFWKKEKAFYREEDLYQPYINKMVKDEFKVITLDFSL